MTQRNKSFIRRLLEWRMLFVINILIVLALSMTLGREVLKGRDIQKEIQELQDEADALASRNVTLGDLQNAIQTQSFIEREARLKLGLKKPGESVVVITEQNYNDDVLVAENQDESDPLGLVSDYSTLGRKLANPTKWWYYFFNQNELEKINTYESGKTNR